MLYVASGGSSVSEASVLRAMFEARKRVFVDLLGWDVPVLDGPFEVDQFDNPYATYVVLTDERGNHCASARLLPTTRPHILDTLYPMLCESTVPSGPDIAEITRFCLDRRLSAPQRRKARDELVSALVDVALAQGIRRYTGVAELGWLQQILAFGWDCRPLGLPQRIGPMTLAALAIEIDASTPRLLAQSGIYRAAPITEARHAA